MRTKVGMYKPKAENVKKLEAFLKKIEKQDNNGELPKVTKG
jgi:hypothetical protein